MGEVAEDVAGWAWYDHVRVHRRPIKSFVASKTRMIGDGPNALVFG